ncbi:choice-of-anchor Q domain-containing protein [Luteolibacter marinus]|uniref:choice-of-anchor Q domain-containing protein n=1 Tax=Luteolibacter marinus TaxID=2776705 RepID=UPI0018692BBF|nr:choice-of-anchor Q domain-containing protein [Luteolibacter marinus]
MKPPSLSPLVTALLLVAPLSPAQVIPNPSFEEDDYNVWPGYAIANGGITGWTAGSAGLNPAAGIPFADNGVTPDGNNVAFIQSSSDSDERISTTITGLTPGVVYEVSFRANCRAGTSAPVASWSLDGGPFVPFTASPAVGEGEPYYTVIGSFTASGPTAALAIRNQTVADSSVLLDDFRIVAQRVPGSAWTLNRWGNDLSSGLSTGNTLWAYAFGTSANPELNGVTMTGVAGGSPAVAGRFSVTGASLVLSADSNQLTALTGSGSAGLAADFIYAGNPTTLTLEGLTAGQAYRVSLFGVGYGGGTARAQTFSSGSNQRVIDEEAFGADNGLRIEHSFVADATNRILTITPTNPVATFHLYGLALHSVSVPSVATLKARDVAMGEATLEGVANPAGEVSTGWFEWGDVDTPFSQSTTPQELGEGEVEQGITADISGLESGVLYRGRAVLSNILGTFYGDPVEFRSGFTAVVTQTDDNGPGSLRQAIEDSVTGDAITFDPALSGQSILLTGGELVIERDLTIDASSLAAGLTLDAQEASRLLSVTADAEVVLTGITLTGGKIVSATEADARGGAILNSGDLTINTCTIAGNAAVGGDHVPPQFSPVTATVAGGNGKGGAIFNEGRLVLNQVTMANNAALGGRGSNEGGNFFSGFIPPGAGGDAVGGAIYSRGILFVHQSTLSDNQASAGSGGDGAIDPISQTYRADGPAGLADGGGIFVETGEATLFNSIVAGNSGGALDNNVTGAFTPAGSNFLSGDPQIAYLAQYGGAMPTMPPYQGSPVLGAGSIEALSPPYNFTTDQQGVTRPPGGPVSIGSVETVLPPSTHWVSSLEDDGSPGSLRQVMALAHPNDTLRFEPGLSGGTIALTGGPIHLAQDVIWDASTLPAGLTLDGQELSRLLIVDAGAEVVLTGLTFINGKVVALPGEDAMGGAILNSGHLTVNACTFAHNSVLGERGSDAIAQLSLSVAATPGGPAAGGAIYNEGTLVLNQVTFGENLARGGAGGDGDTYNDFLSGTTTVPGGTGGLATGGAVHSAGTLIVNQSTLSANSAEGGAGGSLGGETGGSLGGGVFVESGAATLFNSIVAGNALDPANEIAGVYGGAGTNLIASAPSLKPLGDYGGPTPTMPPELGSPAIGAGSPDALLAPYEFTTDQRGFPRAVGLPVDIGAAQIQPQQVPDLADFSATILSSDPASGLVRVELKLSVDPNWLPTVATFSYGSTEPLSGAVGPSGIPVLFAGTSSVAYVLTAEVNLAPGFTYLWRVVASNDVGEVTSATQTFRINPVGVPGDTDGDGVVSREELDAVLAFAEGGLTTINESGYYTAEQVQTLNVGTPLIQAVSPGRFQIVLRMQKSSTLNNDFQPLPFSTLGSLLEVDANGDLLFEFPSDDNAAFFRIESE